MSDHKTPPASGFIGPVREQGWARRDGRLYLHGVELPAGPWHLEADERVFEHAGIACKVIRNPLANWCGYVGVPAGHAWHQIDWMQLGDTVEVHGGLTYADAVCPSREPETAPPDGLWWIGFDTSHAWDLMLFDLVMPKLIPGWPMTRLRELAPYRSQRFTETMTKMLADQVAAKFEN